MPRPMTIPGPMVSDAPLGGADCPGEPPEVVDHEVLAGFQVPVPPTQYKLAMFYPPSTCSACSVWLMRSSRPI